MTGQRVKLFVEDDSGWVKVAGHFTGTIVERCSAGPLCIETRPGLHVELDRGGFLCLLPEEDEPTDGWAAKLIDGIATAARWRVEDAAGATHMQEPSS